MKTKVIFRTSKGGEVVALFPAEAGNVGQPWTCGCYVHIGQHSAASVDYVRDTRLATPKEYRELAAELRRIGYKLDVRKRFTRADLRARQEQLK